MDTSSRHFAQKACSHRSIAADKQQKKRGVILIFMINEESQWRAMSIAGQAKGVDQTKFVGTQLEVIGAGVDWMYLVRRLNKKLGHAQLHSLVPVAVHDDGVFSGQWTAADSPPFDTGMHFMY